MGFRVVIIPHTRRSINNQQNIGLGLICKIQCPPGDAQSEVIGAVSVAGHLLFKLRIGVRGLLTAAAASGSATAAGSTAAARIAHRVKHNIDILTPRGSVFCLCSFIRRERREARVKIIVIGMTIRRVCLVVTLVRLESQSIPI